MCVCMFPTQMLTERDSFQINLLCYKSVWCEIFVISIMSNQTKGDKVGVGKQNRTDKELSLAR